MNAYQKFMESLTQDQRNLLSCYQCSWCSQPGNFGKCGTPIGSPDSECSPQSRVDAAKKILNMDLPL